MCLLGCIVNTRSECESCNQQRPGSCPQHALPSHHVLHMIRWKQSIAYGLQQHMANKCQHVVSVVPPVPSQGDTVLRRF